MASFPSANPAIKSKEHLSSFVIVLDKPQDISSTQQSKGSKGNGSSKGAKGKSSSKGAKGSKSSKGTVPAWARKGRDAVDTDGDWDADE
jgi:hypothetical protein